MTHKDILTFLAERPAINQTKPMEELGCDRRNWYALKRGVRQVPKAKRCKSLAVLENMGIKVRRKLKDENKCCPKISVTIENQIR